MIAKKRVFIIHGWGGSPERNWFPWLAKNLRERGFFVEVPEMPNTDEPKINEWLAHMRKAIANPDENTILVGHSLGGQAILRYLANLPEGVKIKKAILVAPVMDEIKNYDSVVEKSTGEWIKTPIDAKKTKQSVGEIIGFFSDDDPWIPLSSEKTLREIYGARTIIEKDMGHYNFSEAPQVLKEIVG
ncbi:MAG: alpha/beta fold hydrolase [Candidatus Moranbacteria bacterium]|nr:alpha/beta fold hydrolase [Candidatus Moranbacteria bacterium]